MDKTQDESCFKKCVPLAVMDERMGNLEDSDKAQWTDIRGMRKSLTAILTGVCMVLLTGILTLMAVLARG